ncbi:MAG: hypothetical protein IKI11_00230 [Neisseriaceae bacterium]|nr:hypothetical protein [Neisseriaceae bacterium]
MVLKLNTKKDTVIASIDERQCVRNLPTTKNAPNDNRRSLNTFQAA